MILLFTKNDEWSCKAARIAKDIFGKDEVYWYHGEVGDPFPEDVHHWNAKTVLSFLSPWIIPEHVLDQADVALNWHPGPREYPGIGCYNFALYDGAKMFGVTCHFMDPTVDTGRIVDEQRFSVFAHDTVETLKRRTMVVMLAMFIDTVQRIIHTDDGASLKRMMADGVVGPFGALVKWNRRPYTRCELNELCRITPDMDAEEVARRIRATTFPGAPGAFIDIQGHRFEVVV